MSIIDRGQSERDQRQRDAVRQAMIEVEENQRTVEWWFHFVFGSRTVRPVIEDWEPIEAGWHGASEFTCEGVRYRVRWKFEGTDGDRAYWDNGWWPKWSMVFLERCRHWLFFTREVEVEEGVWGPSQVADVLASRQTASLASGIVSDELDDLVELDYGEGKTRAQEAEDSAAMLGLALLAAVVALAAMGVFGWWLFFS